MFKITAPEEKYTREIAGVHFVDGNAQTENEVVARWLEGRGFVVEEESKEEATKPITQMNQKELDAYALELGLQFPENAKVPEKKEIILAFLESQKDVEEN